MSISIITRKQQAPPAQWALAQVFRVRVMDANKIAVDGNLWLPGQEAVLRAHGQSWSVAPLLDGDEVMDEMNLLGSTSGNHGSVQNWMMVEFCNCRN